MKALHKLFYKELTIVIGLVCIGFLSLFYFFDIVSELQAVNQYSNLGYSLPKAFLVVLFMIPNHLYDLLPIAVLIGTVFVMSRFAKNSEFTVLRMSGLTPRKALTSLIILGLAFAVLTFAVGDYIAPYSSEFSQALKARFERKISIGKTSAWLKERTSSANYAVHIGSISTRNTPNNISIYQFNENGAVSGITTSASATFDPKAHGWTLHNGQTTQFSSPNNKPQQIKTTAFGSFFWPTSITNSMVSAALLKPDRMNTVSLFNYINHLKNNGQSAQQYEIQFWKKLFYPLSCLVMVVLALPFAYLHFRSGNIATYVFIGIIAGISFALLNNFSNDFGGLRNWTPWLAAALPSLIYTLISLAAFFWLVLKQ